MEQAWSTCSGCDVSSAQCWWPPEGWCNLDLSVDPQDVLMEWGNIAVEGLVLPYVPIQHEQLNIN